jgi:hypothetical protein
MKSEAEISAEIHTKVLRVSPLLFIVTSTDLPWDFYFFKLTQPLTVSTVHLLYILKEKWGKPDRKIIPPYIWFKKSIQEHHVWGLSRLCPETSMKKNCTFMNTASVLYSTVPQEADSTQPVAKLLKERYDNVPSDVIGSSLPSAGWARISTYLTSLRLFLPPVRQAYVCPMPILADGGGWFGANTRNGAST